MNCRRCLAALLLSRAVVAAPATVAVWDPERGTAAERFAMDLDTLAEVAGWLRDAGLTVERPTTAILAEPAQFSAQRQAALILPGDTFPKAAASNLARFVKDGGILVTLRYPIPLLIRIEPGADGQWTYAPEEPKFAWQSDELLRLFGLRYMYDEPLHDQGVIHTATPLLKQYLPAAPERIVERLTGRWLVTEGCEVYPLIRSQRFDQQDVVPQVFIARQSGRTAIFCTNEVFTTRPDGRVWSLGREMTIALARLAIDLRAGAVDLSGPTVTIQADMPPPEPLQTRLPKGEVNPEGATPMARWGKFDGASLELGPPASGEVGPVKPGEPMPRALLPGASIRVAPGELPAGPVYVRVRGAYQTGGAALVIRRGERIVWSERLSYLDAAGASNFDVLKAGDAIEFQRIAFLPPGEGELSLSNPGDAPLYFDAMQVEQRAVSGPETVVGLGLHGPTYPGGTFTLDPAMSQAWPAIRGPLRTQYIGPPGDPKRWAVVDKLVDTYQGICPTMHLLFEGTPEWCARSADNYAEAKAGGRDRAAVPDPAQYAALAAEIVQRYRGRITMYELWNEPNLRQFFWGDVGQYVDWFRAVVPAVKAAVPDVKLIGPGLTSGGLDFVDGMAETGLLDQVDWLAFHAYAGKTAAWDRVAMRFEGHCYSLGLAQPLYCNEQGAVWRNAQWYQPPPQWTPELQAQVTDVGMARMWASGLCKLNIFNAGGDTNEFGLIDANGQPRPGYLVWADYAKLGHGRRCDVALHDLRGTPLSGIYAAAATHDNGRVTLVLNPAESPALQATPDPSETFDKETAWVTFWGTKALADGRATITSAADQPHAGFYKMADLDPARFPKLRVAVPECDGSWSLMFKAADGTTVPLVDQAGARDTEVDLQGKLPPGRANYEVSFRIKGRAVFDEVRFIPAAVAATIPVVVELPLPQDAEYRSGQGVTVKVHRGQATWAELSLDLRGRTVVELSPVRAGR